MYFHSDTEKVTDVHDCYVQKKGNCADLRLTFKLGGDAGAGHVLFNIPEGFRPKRNIKTGVISDCGSPHMNINSDGCVYCDSALEANAWNFLYVSYLTA